MPSLREMPIRAIGNLPNFACGVTILVWLLAMSAVWIWTVRYEFATYGPAVECSQQLWPSDCSLKLKKDRPTLVIFVHPKCPCTRATMRELDKLLTGAGLKPEQQPGVLVLACQPADVADTWHDTDVLQRASKLPHSELILDTEGRESVHFGAISSGAVMLFDTDGRRLFTGGVTASRGHEGDNAGCIALRRILAGQVESVLISTPVFGCRLCTPAQTQREETCEGATNGCCTQANRLIAAARKRRESKPAEVGVLAQDSGSDGSQAILSSGNIWANRQ